MGWLVFLVSIVVMTIVYLCSKRLRLMVQSLDAFYEQNIKTILINNDEQEIDMNIRYMVFPTWANWALATKMDDTTILIQALLTFVVALLEFNSVSGVLPGSISVIVIGLSVMHLYRTRILYYQRQYILDGASIIDCVTDAVRLKNKSLGEIETGRRNLLIEVSRDPVSWTDVGKTLG